MNMNDQIELLNVPLPEDIMKHKWHGDFLAAERLADRRLAGELPDVMRRRLLLEKKIMRRLPGNYPYTREDVCALMTQEIPDFSDEDMQELMDSDYADWIYIDGVPHFRNNVTENIFKTRADYAARRNRAKKPDEERRHLEAVWSEMRENGGTSRTIRLRSHLWLEEEPEQGEHLRVYLPIPDLDAQVKSVRILRQSAGVSGVSGYVSSENCPQRTICWDVDWMPGMDFTVEYEYDIDAGYLDLWNPVQPETFDIWKERYACFDPVTDDDLSEQQPHIVFTPMLRALAAEITGEETDPMERARRIYDYVTTKIHYSYMRSYVTLPCIPEYVASAGKGDCGAQTLLFITLCRIAGIPARWQSGLTANPGYVGCHDWSRFYIEGYGWLFADCSFGGGGHRSGDEEERRFYFGNLDPFRMPSCRRFQTNFELPMEKLRSDPYDNQSGEVEREDEEAHYRYAYDSDTVMISCQ